MIGPRVKARQAVAQCEPQSLDRDLRAKAVAMGEGQRGNMVVRVANAEIQRASLLLCSQLMIENTPRLYLADDLIRALASVAVR